MGTIPSSVRLTLAAMLCVVGLTKQAGATVTIALEWGECGGGSGGCTATGSDTIGVGSGGTLRLDIFMSHDLTQGLVAHSFSLNFDTDLANELNLGPMAQTEWAGTDVDPGPGFQFYGPFTSGMTTQESSGATAGRINSYESAAFVGVLPRNGAAYTVGTFTATAPARYRVGQAFFTVNVGLTDESDVFAGFFNGALDQVYDGNSVIVPPGSIVFGTARVNSDPIPEPGTVPLLGLGLVGLVLASRRRRS